MVAFDRLVSDESRRRRFLGPKSAFTDRDLAGLANVDHARRDAVAAIDCSDGAIVGAARYGVSPECDRVAELAGGVVDDWQRVGIGQALTARIIERARANGMVRLAASTFADNVQP